MKKTLTLTVTEAAELLGITERAAWQRIYRGLLPHRRCGKRVTILRDELEEYLRSLPGVTVGEAIERAEVAAR